MNLKQIILENRLIDIYDLLKEINSIIEKNNKEKIAYYKEKCNMSNKESYLLSYKNHG